MAVEDFTTYAEVDPNNRITVTAPKCETAGLSRNETAHVSKDRGVDHFGDFECLFTIRTKTSGSADAIVLMAVVANAVDDWKDLSAGIGVMLQGHTTYTIYVAGVSTGYSSNYACADNTIRYCTLTRTGSSVELKIYTDSAKTNLDATLSITLDATDNVNYRYIYGMQSWYDQQVHTITGAYIEDLDLQEVVRVPRHGFTNFQIPGIV